MTAFKNFELPEEEAMISFQHVKNVIQKFVGDGEKFFPSFYNCVSGDKHAFLFICSQLPIQKELQLSRTCRYPHER